MEDTKIMSYEVPAGYESVRIDRYMRIIFPTITEGVIAKSIRKRLIRLNDKKPDISTKLQKGDVITIKYLNDKYMPERTKFNEEREKKPIDLNLVRSLKKKIIYEDDYIIVFNKPNGVPVHDGTDSQRNIDDNLAAFADEVNGKPRIVHRLDKETSGIIVFAKTLYSTRHMNEQFMNRTIEKEYLAITTGILPHKSGQMNNPLASSKGKHDLLPSNTEYKVLKMGKSYNHSLVSLLPKTGRKHQLRQHLKMAGAPIVGDMKYNKKSEEGDELLLHAHKMKLELPDGNTIALNADMPDRMCGFIKKYF